MACKDLKKWLTWISIKTLIVCFNFKDNLVAIRKWYEHHVVARWMCLTVHLAIACVQLELSISYSYYSEKKYKCSMEIMHKEKQESNFLYFLFLKNYIKRSTKRYVAGHA